LTTPVAKPAAVILAYSDRDSVRPGDHIEFKVSCEGVATYHAEIVKLTSFHAAREGPGFHPDIGKPLEEWDLRARTQRIPAGSYGRIDDAFDVGDRFTVGVLIYPTLPGTRVQDIVGNFMGWAGFRLFLDVAGRATFEIGTGEGSASVQLAVPVSAHRWYALYATVDSVRGEIQLGQCRLPSVLRPGESDEASTSRCAGRYAESPAPIGIAARIRADRAEDPVDHFNGKLERPWIARGILSADDVKNWLGTALAQWPTMPGLIGLWDFSRHQDTDQIVDIGPGRHHGRLVNEPLRGATGHNWRGDEWDWRESPDQYAAIHFHDDDLTDCRWNTDFTFITPPDIRGGIYSARLTAADCTFYVPFFVRPARGTKGADTLFLLSTATYLAYANYSQRLFAGAADVLLGVTPVVDQTDINWLGHSAVGLSCYDLHGDGSRVTFSSRLRPILNFRPDEPDLRLGFNNFALDLLVTHWLEHIGVPFDVITDEDLDREGSDALDGYRVLVSGPHPEYQSRSEFAAISGFLQSGGRFMYLGGNGFCWRAAFHRTQRGMIELRRADIVQMRQYKERGQLHHTWERGHGGLWRDLGIPAQALVGVGTISMGFDESRPYRRNPDGDSHRVAFIFDGVEGAVFGTEGILGGAAAGMEIDRVDYAQGTPLHCLVVASSFGHNNTYSFMSGMVEDTMPWGTNATGRAGLDEIRADMTFFETESGGAVFSSGSIAYSGSLSWNIYENPIARLTENVLRRFLDPAVFAVPQEYDRNKAATPGTGGAPW
jgi:N,N-dimethylformamidase